MSKMVQDRAIVTVEHCSEVLCDLSNGIISNDLECPSLGFHGHGTLQRRIEFQNFCICLAADILFT